MKIDECGGNMVKFICAGDQSGSNVLDRLQFSDVSIREACECIVAVIKEIKELNYSQGRGG